VQLLEKAKENIATKEGVLKNKKDELDRIIATTEKEEKHFNKLSVDAREKENPACCTPTIVTQQLPEWPAVVPGLT